ncbi:MAG: hypothetical protein GY827_00340 [Cytophagales bacterium]|nr:hypothetical protein [Cytophagales bacterium]
MKSKLTSLLLGGLLMASATSCVVSYEHQVTGNPVGTKKAVVKSNGFKANNDYSIRKAAKKAGINKIATIDIKTSVFIVPFYKIIVTGE